MPRNATVYADRHQRQRHRHDQPERSAPDADSTTRTVVALTPEERRFERWFAQTSVAGARARIDALLALACVEHDARPGQPCWGDRASGVRGFCSTRYSRVLTTDAQRIHGGKGQAR
ncbi:MAG TPA: hypothetical protein VL294_13325 [Pseudolysinimonas sp.]|jgi:hypothetical protein|nr:hypothetical protein [Pseudolysinimonas sp.]